MPDDNDTVYMMTSCSIREGYKIHGIFTTEYMMSNKHDIKAWREDLKEKHDLVQIFILPTNHYIEKGMII